MMMATSTKPYETLLSPLQGTAYFIPRREAFFLSPSSSTQDAIYHLTGFTGSNAHVLMTPEKLFLYVDDRYTLQAEKQSPDCTIITSSNPIKHMMDERSAGDRIILSPWVWTATEMDSFLARATTQGLEIILDHENTLNRFIKPEPMISRTAIVSMGSDISFQEKCHLIFQDSSATRWILCQAADIAWLTNLRGSDHVYAPFFQSYLIVSKKNNDFSGILYTALPRSIDHLDPDLDVQPLTPLDLCTQSISDASDPFAVGNEPMVYDPGKTPSGLVQKSWIPGTFAKLSQWRSLKTEWEQHHMEQAHIQDGVALVQFLRWISQHPALSTETEWSAAHQLHAFRKQADSYQGHSFPTISAMGPNSAMMHYTPSVQDCDALGDGLYLVDSGGQYHYGTTDVTRTIWLGKHKKPSLIHQEKYTQVLQGHIHLSQMIFPKGTHGIQLDAIARSFLWQKGWDYGHSTGHGVGCFANVHESPPHISQYASRDPIQEHMLFSIEPGYYEKDWGGIRLENLVLVKGHNEHSLKLYPLTLAPFDSSLILNHALSQSHRHWINQYHQRVYRILAPLLDEQTQRWLRTQTQPLTSA